MKSTATYLIREAARSPVTNAGLNRDGGAWYSLSDKTRITLTKREFERLSDLLSNGRYALRKAPGFDA